MFAPPELTARQQQLTELFNCSSLLRLQLALNLRPFEWPQSSGDLSISSESSSSIEYFALRFAHAEHDLSNVFRIARALALDYEEERGRHLRDSLF